MRAPTIAWTRLDRDGRDALSLTETDVGWRFTGVAEFDRTGARSCLAYSIECSRDWVTRACDVTGFVCERAVATSIRRDAGGAWTIDGLESPAVSGCLDIDLAFTPATNTLPIRRLMLRIGDAVAVRAAWLRFPELTLEVLDQTYTRTAANQYLYESASGAFRRTLTVDDRGIVVDYPGLWSATPGPRSE